MLSVWSTNIENLNITCVRRQDYELIDRVVIIRSKAIP